MDRVLSSLYLLGLLDYPDFDPRLAPIQEASKHRKIAFFLFLVINSPNSPYGPPPDKALPP